MKSKIKICYRVITLKLVILFILSFFSPIEVLLCYGEDGHVEIEASTNGVCAGSGVDFNKNINDIPSNLNNASSDHCGPCQDIPISYKQNWILNTNTSKLISKFSFLFYQIFKSFNKISELKIKHYSIHISDQFLKQIHSQILRI